MRIRLSVLVVALALAAATANYVVHAQPGAPPSVSVQTPAPAPAPAVTQNTVTTTGPVASETTISVGTLAGQVLMWAIAAFSVPIGGVLTALVVRLFTAAGIQNAGLLSKQLNETIVNGLNAGAANLAQKSKGMEPIQIKNQIVQDAIAYAQAHRADTIQALGLDPKSGAAVQAIKARIETLITDPTVPTPAVLDPAAPAKV